MPAQRITLSGPGGVGPVSLGALTSALGRLLDASGVHETRAAVVGSAVHDLGLSAASLLLEDGTDEPRVLAWAGDAAAADQLTTYGMRLDPPLADGVRLVVLERDAGDIGDTGAIGDIGDAGDIGDTGDTGAIGDTAHRRAVLRMFAAQAGLALDRAELAEQARLAQPVLVAFEKAPIGISVVDLRPGSVGRHLRVNDTMCRLLGYDRSELLGRTTLDITHPDDTAHEADAIEQALAGGLDNYSAEKRYLGPDGRSVWVALRAVVVRDPDGNAVYGVTQFEDIGQRRAEHVELVRRSRVDALTGLLNRGALTERVQESLTTASRTGHSGAVLFCDLDAFKPVNDSLGHSFGDQVLAIVARRLDAQLRTGDTTGRWGGDEFVVVADDVGQAEVDDLAGRIESAVAAPIDVAGRTVRVAVTVGRTRVTGEVGETAGAVIARADADMYARKPYRHD